MLNCCMLKPLRQTAKAIVLGVNFQGANAWACPRSTTTLTYVSKLRNLRNLRNAVRTLLV